MTDNAIHFEPRTVVLPGSMLPLSTTFLTQLQRRGYAENTIKAYQHDLERFVGFMLSRDVSLVQLVTSLHVNQFIDALLDGEQLGPRSAMRNLNTLRSFFHWLETQGLVTALNNPLRADFRLKFEPRKIMAPEISKLLAFVNGIPADSVENLRDRAAFRLMLDGGMRVGGVCCLDLYDPQHPPEYHVSPAGVVQYRAKGGRVEQTVVDDETLAAIDAWLEVRDRFRRRSSPPALFLSKKGTRPTPACLHYRIKLHGKRARMPFMHCHLLRHGRIGDALERGNLHIANYLAGHKDKRTTAAIYGDQPQERLRNLVRQQCGLDGVAA